MQRAAPNDGIFSLVSNILMRRDQIAGMEPKH